MFCFTCDRPFTDETGFETPTKDMIIGNSSSRPLFLQGVPDTDNNRLKAFLRMRINSGVNPNLFFCGGGILSFTGRVAKFWPEGPKPEGRAERGG